MPRPFRLLPAALVVLVLSPSAPARADAVEEMFSVARARRQSNQSADAAASFKTIGIEHPDHPLAERAMLEYFDILAPGLSPPEYASLQEAITVAPIFVEGLCARAKNKTGCAKLTTLHCDLLRLDAERRIRGHEGMSDADRSAMKEAGDIYLSIWKRYADAPGAKESCRMDEVLYNAAYAYRGARTIDDTLSTLGILVDPKNGFTGSALFGRALFEMGQTHVVLADYAEALKQFERLASVAPKDERAPDALYNAVILRIQLGLVPEALEDAEQLFRLHGAARKAESMAMSLEIGRALVEREEYEHAKAWLEKTLSMVKRDGSFEQKLVAAGALGRALEGLGDGKGAAAQYRGVFASASSGGWLRSAESNAPNGMASAWAHPALDVVSDAAVFLLRAEGADAKRIPVSKAIEPMQRAIDARAEVIERATDKYGKPEAMLKTPPAKWVVGASAAIAGLWIAMADELRSGLDAMKRAKAKPEELRTAQAAAEPALRRAKAAASDCVKRAVELQQWSKATKRCQLWLEERFPKEHRAIEEFSPGFRDSMASAVVPGGARPIER